MLEAAWRRAWEGKRGGDMHQGTWKVVKGYICECEKGVTESVCRKSSHARVTRHC